jgi:hypothetical protein
MVRPRVARGFVNLADCGLASDIALTGSHTVRSGLSLARRVVRLFRSKTTHRETAQTSGPADPSWTCTRCGGTIEAISSRGEWIIGLADECPDADHCADLALKLLTVVGAPDSVSPDKSPEGNAGN